MEVLISFTNTYNYISPPNNPPKFPVSIFSQFPFSNTNSVNYWSEVCSYSVAFSRMTYKWNPEVVAFSAGVLSLFEVYPCLYMLLVACPPYGWVVFYCMEVPKFVYPFVSWEFKNRYRGLHKLPDLTLRWI